MYTFIQHPGRKKYEPKIEQLLSSKKAIFVLSRIGNDTIKNKEVKPSDLFKFDDIPTDAPIDHSSFEVTGANVNNYYWYFKDGMYAPYRKPTISEINNDKFN